MKNILFFAVIASVLLSSCEIIIHDEEPVFFDARDKFLGNYNVEEYSDTYDEIAEYALRITKSSHDEDIIFLENFYGVHIDVLAQVRGDKIIIPLQEVDGYEIEGEAWYDHGNLDFDYVVRDVTRYHSVYDFCTAVAW